MDQEITPQGASEPAPVFLPYSTLATVSMVMGILGFTFLPIIASVVALVTGYMARKETRAVPPMVTGDGMATAGIIMGWVQIGLAVVGCLCVAAVLVFGLSVLGITSRGR